jgi:ferritin-like metal-binding protein YciE
MGLFSISLNSAQDLLMVQLETLYDSEKRLADAIPAIIRAANFPELRQVLAAHQQQADRHLVRLEEIFGRLGNWAQRETCAAMKGLIADALNLANAAGEAAVKDAALIGAVQAIDHYEIASYGTARCLARQLRLDRIEALLQEMLDEETEADRALTAIAGLVNQHAQPA